MNTDSAERQAAPVPAELVRRILATHIQPLLPGSTMLDPVPGTRDVRPQVVYDTKNRLKIDCPRDIGMSFMFQRRVPFCEEERVLVEVIINEIHRGRLLSGADLADIAGEAVTTAIAGKIAPENPETLLRVIHIYEQWACRACESANALHTTGILLTQHRKARYSIFSPGEQRVLTALGSSRDTLLVIDAGGGVLGVEKLSPQSSREKDRQDLFAPVRHASVADWTTSRRKAAVRLAEGGAILLFAGRRLLFVKRDGFWHGLPHSLIDLETVLVNDEIKTDTARAVYLTALDLAAEKTAIAVGLIRKAGETYAPAILRKAGLRFSPDIATHNAGLVASVLKAKNFSEIPRAVRAELCAPGGTLILDSRGTILGLEFSGKDQQSGDAFPLLPGEGMSFWDKCYTELVNSGCLGVRLTIC